MTRFKPILNNLLIDNFILQNESKLAQGTVVEVGPTCMLVEKNDVVVFLPGNLFSFRSSNGEQAHFLNETNVIARDYVSTE